MSKSTSNERKKRYGSFKGFLFFSLAHFVFVFLVCQWGDFISSVNETGFV